ncbi:MAG: hypothetical protein AABX53_03480 [Nanoarchaeota archaeon]
MGIREIVNTGGAHRFVYDHKKSEPKQSGLTQGELSEEEKETYREAVKRLNYEGPKEERKKIFNEIITVLIVLAVMTFVIWFVYFIKSS